MNKKKQDGNKKEKKNKMTTGGKYINREKQKR